MSGDTGAEQALAAALARFVQTSPRLVALDFDGVCAPIVDVPAQARMLPGVRAALHRLVAQDGVRVALVSGRALDDLRAVAEPEDDVVLVGSHGAETDGADGPLLGEAERALLQQLRQDVAEVSARHEGTSVEDKPAGVALHTRRAPREQAAAAELEMRAAAPWPSGVHVRHGKEVIELSVLAADKGRALLRLRDITGCAAVLYVGDDVTDEDAFAVLDDDEGDVTVKVGSGETVARHRVGAPEELPAVLLALLESSTDGQSGGAPA